MGVEVINSVEVVTTVGAKVVDSVQVAMSKVVDSVEVAMSVGANCKVVDRVEVATARVLKWLTGWRFPQLGGPKSEVVDIGEVSSNVVGVMYLLQLYKEKFSGLYNSYSCYRGFGVTCFQLLLLIIRKC